MEQHELILKRLEELDANIQSLYSLVEDLHTKLDAQAAQASAQGETIEIDDDLYEEAKAAVINAGKASTSFIQRKFRIGYSKAARLMDMLEENSVIGPQDGAKPREVLKD